MKPAVLRQAACASLLAVSSAAGADGFALKQSQICVDGMVDKALLARSLLDAAQASRRLEDWVGEHPSNRPELKGLSPRERMIADETLCARVGEGDKAKAPAYCSESDAKNLPIARQALITMLASEPGSFQNIMGVRDPAQFFASPAAGLRCLTTATGQPVEIAGAAPRKFDLKVPIRVRGASDGIQYSRADTAQFKPLDKATVSFANDKVKNKKTEKWSVFVGYPFPLTDKNGQTAELVPYVGWTRDAAKTNGTRSVNGDAFHVGAVFDDLLTLHQVTHWFVVRPDYAFNRKENSELGSTTLTYVPVINGVINDYLRLIPGDDHFISVEPMLDVRFVGRHFFRQGSRSDDDSRDFLRLGGQVGLSFSSDLAAFPADLTLTELYLPALNGSRPTSATSRPFSRSASPRTSRSASMSLTRAGGRMTCSIGSDPGRSALVSNSNEKVRCSHDP